MSEKLSTITKHSTQVQRPNVAADSLLLLTGAPSLPVMKMGTATGKFLEVLPKMGIGNVLADMIHPCVLPAPQSFGEMQCVLLAR